MARPTPDKLRLLQQRLKAKGIEKQQSATIPRRAPDQEVPLSYGQQRMWFLQQLEPDSSEYNDTLTIRIRGLAIDTELFGLCCQEVVRRHEALRTAFLVRAGTPFQCVLPELELPLRVVDLSERSDLEEARRALWLEEVRGAFVLDRPPLLRATLAKLAGDDWEFGLTMHHIVSDGVAYTIFFREVSALYRALGAGQPSPLAELPVQFADYAVWERDVVTEEVIESKLGFWKRYLGGDLPALQLPTDHQRQGPPGHRGAFLRLRFDDALFDALQDFCKRERVTSNWVLLAAYFALWYRFSGQRDIALGTPSSVRNRRELEALIGFFVQTLILRLDLAGNPTFRELIGRARRQALEVQPYEDVPFDRIFQAVRPGKAAAEAPLIQAWIAPMKNLLEPISLPGADSEYEIVDPHNARFDIALILDETQDKMTGYWEYDVELFEPGTVARIDRQFQALLAHVLRHPDTSLDLLRETLRAAEDEQRARARQGRRDKRLDSLKKVRRRRL